MNENPKVLILSHSYHESGLFLQGRGDRWLTLLWTVASYFVVKNSKISVHFCLQTVCKQEMLVVCMCIYKWKMISLYGVLLFIIVVINYDCWITLIPNGLPNTSHEVFVNPVSKEALDTQTYTQTHKILTHPNCYDSEILSCVTLYFLQKQLELSNSW